MDIQGYVDRIYTWNENFARKHSNKVLAIGALLLAIGLAPEIPRFIERRETSQRINRDYPAKTVHLTPIDGDGLSDLVVGSKIFLADKTSEGTVYRPLSNSDIYRIK